MFMAFWTEGPTHTNDIKNPQPLNEASQEIVSTKSPEVYRVCEAVASPNLPLTGDTLVTEGILIFQI